MPGARAVQLAEIADFVDRRMRVTREMQRRISEHRAMPRRQHESVAIRPRRIGGIELQIIRIGQCRDIGTAPRPPGTTAVPGLYRVHRTRAEGPGELACGEFPWAPATDCAEMRIGEGREK